MKAFWGEKKPLLWKNISLWKVLLEKESSTLKKSLGKTTYCIKRVFEKKDSFIRKRELYY